MIRALLPICVLASMILFHGCGALTGENVYINKQYQNKPTLPNKLTIVPLTRLGPPLVCPKTCPPLEQTTDELFEKSFGNLPGKVFLMPMAKARNFFTANPDILDRILNVTYSEQELRDNPDLKGALDNKGLASLREQLDDADLLLVPQKLDLVPKFGRVFGYSEFRLYDLRSGSMIYASSKSINVDRGDEPGRGITAFVLMGYAKTDFEKYYLNK